MAQVIKKKIRPVKGIAAALDPDGEWDQVVIDLKKEEAIYKKYASPVKHTKEEIKELWKKIPNDISYIVKRFLKFNENKQGKLTLNKAYDILFYLIERHEKFKFSWSEIAQATEISLEKGIKNKSYIGGILRGERERIANVKRT